MCKMISCLISRDCKVFAVDGVHSHTGIAKHFSLDEDKYLKYEFHLDKRELFQDFAMDQVPFSAKASHDRAAQAFFDDCAGTAEKLIAFVRRGNWDQDVLLPLLTPEARAEHYKVCVLAQPPKTPPNKTRLGIFRNFIQ